LKLFEEKTLINPRIVVVGLGYVGLPLAVEFGKKYHTIGIDIDSTRIEQLNDGYDKTLELTKLQVQEAVHLTFTSSFENLNSVNETTVFIITVPTPIDIFKRPNLQFLQAASQDVGKILKKGDIVVYESTVYPGCTEDDCVPILEKASGLTFNQDFFCGYSPERINPGDKVRTLTKILKITSGSTPEIATFIDKLYDSILEAGTHKASSIRVAEAAKLIENCQRDVNISFVNELALIFDRMGIDTTEVLEAAGTKWNFLPFKPGLVGGHCIGVDPYYMIHKAKSLGYYPAVIGAGRRINNNMGVFVANKVIKLMIQKEIPIKRAKGLILGFTFKENCPDIRNTGVVEVYKELTSFGIDVDIYDPWANKNDVKTEYHLSLTDQLHSDYDMVILAVAHREFETMNISSFTKKNHVFFDIKSIIDKNQVDGRL
jgi:UDP-N-acetyl-D-galactosamine dehydrogenase